MFGKPLATEFLDEEEDGRVEERFPPRADGGKGKFLPSARGGNRSSTLPSSSSSMKSVAEGSTGS